MSAVCRIHEKYSVLLGNSSNSKATSTVTLEPRDFIMLEFVDSASFRDVKTDLKVINGSMFGRFAR